MIKAIIFDWGNVLEYFDNEGFVKEISKTFSLDPVKFAKKEFANRIRFDAGEFTTEGFLAEMSREFWVAFTVDNYFGPFYSQYIKPILPVQKLLKKLKKHYRLFLLSNNSEIAHDRFKRGLPFSKDFEKIVISYEHKLLKPDPRIYKILLEGTGLKPEECLYIDDLPEFIEGAKNSGMKTILYKKPEQLIHDLDGLGIRMKDS
ncbi:MAG: HAD family phosphatase [Nanoarchaeota archaeon]